MSKSRLNFPTYPQDYYCGSQVRIYFGSIWVDEVATIQYQSTHSKVPLYGYGDHQFRAVAKGQLIVRGNFTVAFKETGYLYSIIQLIKADVSPIEDTKTKVGTYLDYLARGMTVEQALDLAAAGQRSKDFGGGTSTSDFEDISEVLEDAIWGKEGTPSQFSNSIPRSDELDYYKYTGTDKTKPENSIDKAGFDILMTFGNYRSGSDNPEHTIISINDVHITSESVIVTPAAEPIGLSCEFFARGINERVSTNWGKQDQTTKTDIKNEEKPSTTDKIIEQSVNTNETIPTSTTPGTLVTQSNDFIGPTQESSGPLQQFSSISSVHALAPNIVISPPPVATNKVTGILKDKSGQSAVLPGPDPNAKFSTIVQLRTDDVEYIFDQAKIEAKKSNLIIAGTSSNGTIQGLSYLKSVKGNYRRVGKLVRINIMDKPFTVTNNMIKEKINEFFSNT